MNLTLCVRRLVLLFANLLTEYKFKPTSLSLYFTEHCGVWRADMALVILKMSFSSDEKIPITHSMQT